MRNGRTLPWRIQGCTGGDVPLGLEYSLPNKFAHFADFRFCMHFALKTHYEYVLQTLKTLKYSEEGAN